MNNVNNDMLAAAMRSIIDNRLTIDWHRPETPAGLTAAAAAPEYDTIHLVVDGPLATMRDFLGEDEYDDDGTYGEKLLRVIAGYNAAKRVVEDESAEVRKTS
jgi:hypothetical protein